MVFHSLIDRELGVGLPAPNYSDYSEYWSFSEWIEYTEVWSERLLRCSCSTEALAEIRERYGDDSLTLQALVEVLKVRHSDLRKALANAACKRQPAYLHDFDWQLQLVLGSDKVASIEEPALEIALDIRGEASFKPRTLELSSDQLDNFIETLETMNKELLQKQL